MSFNVLDEMDKAIQDDILEEGNYLCELHNLTFSRTSTNKDMITAVLYAIEDEEGNKYSARFFENFVFQRKDGNANEIALQRFYTMLAALSDYTNKEDIYNKYLRETVGDTSRASSVLVGAKCVVWIKQVPRFDGSEEKVENQIAVFKQIPEKWSTVPF